MYVLQDYLNTKLQHQLRKRRPLTQRDPIRGPNISMKIASRNRQKKSLQLNNLGV